MAQMELFGFIIFVIGIALLIASALYWENEALIIGGLLILQKDNWKVKDGKKGKESFFLEK